MNVDSIMEILKKADDDGLFDRATSQRGLVPMHHRTAIRQLLREYEEEKAKSNNPPTSVIE